MFYPTDSPTPQIYTLSLHDALPICRASMVCGRATAMIAARKSRKASSAAGRHSTVSPWVTGSRAGRNNRKRDRKSTRLNSQSHSDLVCRLLLEKKNEEKENERKRTT